MTTTKGEGKRTRREPTRVAYYEYNHKNVHNDEDDVHAAHNYHMCICEVSVCVLMCHPIHTCQSHIGVKKRDNKQASHAHKNKAK